MPKMPTSHFRTASNMLCFGSSLDAAVYGVQTTSTSRCLSTTFAIHRRSCDEKPTARAFPCCLALARAATICSTSASECRPPRSCIVMRHTSTYSSPAALRPASRLASSFSQVRHSGLRGSFAYQE